MQRNKNIIFQITQSKNTVSVYLKVINLQENFSHQN